MTTLSPITAVIPDFTVTPVINTPTFPEDIDQYNSELPSVINAQQATSSQMNNLVNQLNTFGSDISEIGSSTLSASKIAIASANFKGAWSSTSTYTVPSSVSFSGSFYAAIATNTNNPPPNASYWVKIPVDSVLDSTSSLVSSSAVAVNAFFTGVTASAFVSIKIPGLPTATTGGVLDFGSMIVKIMQDDRDVNGATIPDSWVIFVKGDMKTGVWENAQAINIATSSSSSTTLSVNFTRTATDAYVEFDFTALGISYMSVVVESVNTYSISGYSPSISISMQTSKIGTLATDFVRAVVNKQDSNSILTALTNNNLPIVNAINTDLNTLSKTGLYTLGTGNTNQPTGGLWVFNMWWSTTNVFQLCWDTSGGMWSRYLLGSTWSSWVKLQPALSARYGLPDYNATPITRAFSFNTVYTTTVDCIVEFRFAGSGRLGIDCVNSSGTVIRSIADLSTAVANTFTFPMPANGSYKFTQETTGLSVFVLFEIPLIRI